MGQRGARHFKPDHRIGFRLEVRRRVHIPEIELTAVAPEYGRGTAAGLDVIVRRRRVIAEGLSPDRAVGRKIIQFHDKERRNIARDGNTGRAGDIEIIVDAVEAGR